ncbi:hypothetical protein ACG2QI_01830 [Bacillus sp. GM2]|uniref:hypothetical protein n=1 Tax=Bacillus TaxID=1386 RepID=UPI0013312004|nr:hypothetical protein [Bacillus subtilis]MDL2028212.1 hypothetical protein [Bacillus subtilis]QYM58630.1 hypothetical protein K0V03_11450 [Bacillus subtilis]
MVVVAKTLDDFSHIVRNHGLNGIEPVHIYYSCDYEDIAYNQIVEPGRTYKYTLALFSTIQTVFHSGTFDIQSAREVGQTISNLKSEFGFRPELCQTLELIDGNIIASNFMDMV